ncbi:MAG: hypothetical protein ABL994_22785 [Verrucomicrobiales bacterium]
MPSASLHAIAALMRPDIQTETEFSAEELATLQALARERGSGVIQLGVELIRQQLAKERLAKPDDSDLSP